MRTFDLSIITADDRENARDHEQIWRIQKASS